MKVVLVILAATAVLLIFQTTSPVNITEKMIFLLISIRCFWEKRRPWPLPSAVNC